MKTADETLAKVQEKKTHLSKAASQIETLTADLLRLADEAGSHQPCRSHSQKGRSPPARPPGFGRPSASADEVERSLGNFASLAAPYDEQFKRCQEDEAEERQGRARVAAYREEDAFEEQLKERLREGMIVNVEFERQRVPRTAREGLLTAGGHPESSP